MSEPKDDIVATLRECAKDSRASEGDYYADQFATNPEVFECAATEIERLRHTLAVFVHAHETGNFVSPSIEREAKLLSKGGAP